MASTARDRATAPSIPPPEVLPPDRARRLRVGNAVVGLVHLVQAAVILVLSQDFDLAITETFAAGPPGTPPPAPEPLLDVPLGPATAAFLLLAAADHLLVASPGIHRWYERHIRHQINPARWIEYSVSATLMILLIAMVSGAVDVTALVGIAGANVAMILFGHRMERVNGQLPMGSPQIDFQPWWFGAVAGTFPWIAVGFSIIGAEVTSGGQVPDFVWGIYASILVLFSSFGINQYVQYKGVGPWRDYVVGEWAYIALSLIAKSALAWQVFANVLVEQ